MEGGFRLVEMIPYGSPQKENRSNPYMTTQGAPPVFQIEKKNGSEEMVRTSFHPFIADDLHFPERKNQNTFRIFCLGGSAAMGWPHELSESYPSYLLEILQNRYPSKKIEIINAAASTYASYRVKYIFDEVINYDPDLILIFSGNNEFLEHILYNDESPLRSPWRHFATVRVVHEIKNIFGKKKPVLDFKNYEPTFLIDIALGNTSPLKTSPNQLEKVKAHYEYNITEIVKHANISKVPVALLNVPTNIKDWSPHASIHGTEIDLPLWQKSFQKAMDLLEQKEYQAALPYFLKCVEIDSSYARSHYYLGKTFLALRRIPEAKSAFTNALIHDAYPFRALPEFNRILSKISVQNNTPLIDLVQLFENMASDSIIGEDVLIDHVHPRIFMNQKIAIQVADVLTRSGILPIPASEPNTPPGISSSKPRFAYYKHLFLIYRVLLQFDKIDRLSAELQDIKDSENNSTRYLLLKDQMNNYSSIAKAYQELLRFQEIGKLDSIYTPEQQQHIISDYIQMNRIDLASKMDRSIFEKFIPK